ncbi:ras-related protein Rab-8B isoform X1 [Penaeus vannamei]|uniref:ras-related protein Rab-8B isoform X1 n=1 Tax=Penaeus vannamei TaxID=6689 RepID=UPI00387F6FAC
MARTYDNLFKVLLLGDANVGKTALLVKFASEAPTDHAFISTIGVDFKIRILQVCGRKVKLQMWDTAGQEKFHNVTSAFYRGASGILVVYDVASEKSYENIQKWLADVGKNCADNTVTMILGNNCHLKGDERQVSWERAKEMADKAGVQFMEVSAKTGQNTEEALNILSKSMLAKEPNIIVTSKETSSNTRENRCSVQ